MKKLTMVMVLLIGIFLMSGVAMAEEVVEATASGVAVDTEGKEAGIPIRQGGGIIWNTGEYKNYSVFKIIGTKEVSELPADWPTWKKLFIASWDLNAGGAYDNTNLKDGLLTISKSIGSLGDYLSWIDIPKWVSNIKLTTDIAGLYVADVFDSDREYDGFSGVGATGKLSISW